MGNFLLPPASFARLVFLPDPFIGGWFAHPSTNRTHTVLVACIVLGNVPGVCHKTLPLLPSGGRLSIFDAF
jgi:hypothetical protein